MPQESTLQMIDHVIAGLSGYLGNDCPPWWFEDEVAEAVVTILQPLPAEEQKQLLQHFVQEGWKWRSQYHIPSVGEDFEMALWKINFWLENPAAFEIHQRDKWRREDEIDRELEAAIGLWDDDDFSNTAQEVPSCECGQCGTEMPLGFCQHCNPRSSF